MKDNKRILIIDDDEGIRKIYQRIFTPEQGSDVIQKGMALFDTHTKESKYESSTFSGSTQEYQLSLAENGIKGSPSLVFSSSNFFVYIVGSLRTMCISSPDDVSNMMSPTSPNRLPVFDTTVLLISCFENFFSSSAIVNILHLTPK